MKLNELIARVDRLQAIGQLFPAERPRLVAFVEELSRNSVGEQQASALQRLGELLDSLPAGRARLPQAMQEPKLIAGLLELAERLKLPASQVLPGAAADLMQRLDALIDRAQAGPAAPSIFEEPK